MSFILSSLNKFSNYLNTEAQRKKNEAMYFYDYIKKQSAAQKTIENLGQMKLVPEGINTEELDPLSALDTYKNVISIKRQQEQDQKDQILYDETRTKNSYIISDLLQKQKDQQFLRNNTLLRKGNSILLRSTGEDGKITESDVTNNPNIDPRLSSEYNDMQNTIADDIRMANSIKYNSSLLPKESNYYLKDGTLKLLVNRNGEYYTPSGDPFDANLIDRKAGVGAKENDTLNAERTKRLSTKYKTDQYNYAKQIITNFRALGSKAESVLENFNLNDKGNTDYVSIANALLKGDTWKKGKLDDTVVDNNGKEIYQSQKFYRENKELFDNLYKSTKNREFNDLKAEYNITEDKFYEMYKEYENTVHDPEFGKLNNADKLKKMLEYFNKQKPQTTDTNQNKIKMNDLF